MNPIIPVPMRGAPLPQPRQLAGPPDVLRGSALTLW